MMWKKLNLLSVLTIGVLLCLIIGASAEGPAFNSGQMSFAKSAQDKVTRTQSNINNWSYWQYYDGKSGNDPAGNSGGIYPRGTAGVVFQDGFVWGGITEGNIKVGGQTYNVGTQPGWIQTDGSAVNPNDDRVRIYRIRSDWRTLAIAQVRQDAAEVYQIKPDEVTDAQAQSIIDQYAADWQNWPTDLGAPYVDVDGDGTYDPNIDQAGIADADQVIWYVVNDLDRGRTTFMYGSDPIGLELQVTIWGYAQQTARLGQLVFKKYKLINKAGPQIDSMYVAQWCDPDVGSSSDDVVGCDTTLSLGYAYNGSATDPDFDPFGLAPPAIGYDFFQGPIVAGKAGEDLNGNGVDDAEDYAIFNLEKVGPGYINLPMTSFGYFSAGNEEWEDPVLQEYQGTLEWYNLLRGYITTDNVNNPTPFTNRNTGEVTKYPLAGDPVTGTGDIDGEGGNFSPADRRMALCSGPFNMAPGDTQEVVVALLGGSGDTRIQSVSDLKLNDVVAQVLFDTLFQGIPKPPAPPKVEAVPFEDEIVLNWGFDHQAVSQTEDNIRAGYAFEGYNVYMLPSPTATKSQGVRVATFDVVDGVETIMGKQFVPQFGQEVVVPVQYGTDAGVQRYISIDQNYLTEEALFPGNTYYFAVTAYNYNANPELIEDKTLESPLTIFPVTTQSTLPGTRYPNAANDFLDVTQTAGKSDGEVLIKVINPSKTTGHDYEVFFDNFEVYSPVLDSAGNEIGTDTTVLLGWNLRDATAGEVLLTNQRLAPSLDAAQDAPIIDGVQIQVASPEPTFKSIAEVAYNGEAVDPADNVWHSLNSNATYYVSAGGGDGGFDRLGRWVTYAVPRDFELRFTDGPNYGVSAFSTDNIMSVPFELWDITNERRMIPFIYENVARDTFGYDGDTEPVYQYPASDWVYWMDPQAGTTGDVAYQNMATAAEGAGGVGNTYPYASDGSIDGYWADFHGGFVYPIGRWVFGDYNIGSGIPSGTTIRVITTKPITTADAYTFSTGKYTTSIADAKNDVEKITVFPNPYYAYNPQEPDRLTKFVKFYHLPPRSMTKTTIRIFDLAGSLVRTLEKTDDNQFMQWDLRNESNLPVASGMYIAHIDMPELGKEKVLKLFIVQRAQILEFY